MPCDRTITCGLGTLIVLELRPMATKAAIGKSVASRSHIVQTETLSLETQVNKSPGWQSLRIRCKHSRYQRSGILEYSVSALDQFGARKDAVSWIIFTTQTRTGHPIVFFGSLSVD